MRLLHTDFSALEGESKSVISIVLWMVSFLLLWKGLWLDQRRKHMQIPFLWLREQYEAMIQNICKRKPLIRVREKRTSNSFSSIWHHFHSIFGRKTSLNFPLTLNLIFELPFFFFFWLWYFTTIEWEYRKASFHSIFSGYFLWNQEVARKYRTK